MSRSLHSGEAGPTMCWGEPGRSTDPLRGTRSRALQLWADRAGPVWREGVAPASIVDFSRNVVEKLADGVRKVLAADRRSDGLRQADRFNLRHTAEAVLDVYRTALKAFTSPAP
jgi:hypothetical protein